MIRLVRIGAQIEKDKDQFEFYDTVSNTFISFVSYEMQVFDSIIYFKEVAPHNHPREAGIQEVEDFLKENKA